MSLGGLWRAVEDRVELKLDLSSASRFPNGDELYMNGSAPTSPVYALGDPSLGVETTWGASPTIGFRFPWLEAEASVYGNLIDDYIYFAPAIGDDGEPAYDITIRGAYPRFTFQAVDAVFYGTDGGLSLGPELPVGVELSGAIVRGQERSTGEGLIGVPPDRAQATVIVRPPDTGSMRDSFVEVSGVLVGAQTRVDPQADLAPPPDAYALLHAAIGTNVGFRGDRVLRLGVEGTNLTNSSYREYTSLLRYFADEPGRSFRLRIGFDF